jgi:predicted GNAT family acetyltransferase
MYGRIRSLRTWVAESEGQLLSAASTSAETADAAMIGGVWTAPDARRRGLSTAVMSALSRELIEEGRRPYLFYLTNTVAAAHVYSQVGYATVGHWSVIYLTSP